MSIKKPTANSGKNAAVLIGGVVLGVMASRMGFGFIDDPSKNPDPKKAEQATMVKRVVGVAAGGALAAAAQGTDKTTDFIKAFGAGVAVDNGLELLKTGAEKGGVEGEATAATTGKKAVARALGLGCNCSNMGLGRRKRKRGLGAYDVPAYVESGMDRPVMANSASTVLDNNPLLRAIGAA